MSDYLYKIETHVHTSEGSGCSQLAAEDQVRLYKEQGYAGMVITDHFGHGVCSLSVDDWLKGYQNALEAGVKYGVKVYFGLEWRLAGGCNDYLLYGASPSFLERYPNIWDLSLPQFKEIADRHRLLVIQAHPFRPGIKQDTIDFVHGYEVYNGARGNEGSRNDLALAYWREQGGLALSGSDCHQLHQVGKGGIITKYLPEDEASLAELMRKDDFQLIADPEFQSWL